MHYKTQQQYVITQELFRLIQCLAKDGQADVIARLSEMGDNKKQLEDLYQKYNL